MIGRIGQGESGAEGNTVTDEVVEGELCGKAVQCLLDNRTILVVVASRHAEVGLLTTTRDGQVMILVPSHLLDFVHPVSIVIPVLKFSPGAVVVYLIDIGGGHGTL